MCNRNIIIILRISCYGQLIVIAFVTPPSISTTDLTHYQFICNSNEQSAFSQPRNTRRIFTPIVNYFGKIHWTASATSNINFSFLQKANSQRTLVFKSLGHSVHLMTIQCLRAVSTICIWLHQQDRLKGTEWKAQGIVQEGRWRNSTRRDGGKSCRWSWWIVIFATPFPFCSVWTGRDAFWPAKTNPEPISGLLLSKARAYLCRGPGGYPMLS